MNLPPSIPELSWETPPQSGLVSVVTIVRNDRDGLARTLQSVAAQSFQSIDHVVVDGASSDGGGDLLSESSFRGLRWISEPDRGISDAFNKGLALSRGEWIQFLNAGDLYRTDSSLDEMVGHLGEARVLTGFSQMSNTRIPARVLSASDPLRLRALISHQATLTHRQVFEDCGGFDANLRFRMDYELWLRVLPRYPAHFVNEVFTEYASGGHSSDLWGFHREERVANRRHLARPRAANFRTALRPLWLKLSGR